jgi:hypothetical protein
VEELMAQHVRILGVATCVALASTACVINVNDESVVVREERRFAVSGDPDLALNTFDGSIRVQAWDRNEVLVEIERRGATREEAESIQIRATQDGNRIQVEVPRIERDGVIHVGNFTSPSASLLVSVPRRVSLRAETGDGSITAQRIAGRIELRSGDGSIRSEDVEGDVSVNTGDGSVAVVGANGRVDLTSGDGSITVRGRLDGVRVSTGDGSVDVEAETGSAMSDDWTVTTGDGSITLRFPEGFDAELDAESGDGTVSAAGSAFRGELDDDRQKLRGRLGNGGRNLRLRSGDGPIRVIAP